MAGAAQIEEAGRGNPFTRKTVLFMFGIGFIAFIALLYALGAGNALRDTRNGQAHAGSNSLVGYSALAKLLENTGSQVRFARTVNALNGEGLAIVTPNIGADADELYSLVQRRTYVGPTLIILPKWTTEQHSPLKPDWVKLIAPTIAYSGAAVLREIVDAKIRVTAPDGSAIEPTNVFGDNSDTNTPQEPATSREFYQPPVTISGDQLTPLVIDPRSGDAQIALIDDGGWYPALDANAPDNPEQDSNLDTGIYPVIIIADADLANNLGMADKAKAAQIYDIISASMTGGGSDIVFDLTFNGLGGTDNLLTMAFKPPFLSATICLILAALALAWMAFNRFGPPLRERRAIDFGKAALVENSAGLLRRLRRDNVMANAYADLVRDRAARAVGLPANMPGAEAEARLSKLKLAERAGRQSGDGSHTDNQKGFADLMKDLRGVRDRKDLTDKAAALARWKKDILQ